MHVAGILLFLLVLRQGQCNFAQVDPTAADVQSEGQHLKPMDLPANEDYTDEDDDEDFDDESTDSISNSNATLQFVRDLKNVTKPTGQVVRFRCEVKVLETNSTLKKVNFKWRQHAAYLPDDPRFKQRTFFKAKTGVTISWLKISDLETLDRGWYFCTASKGSEKITSKAFLEVKDRIFHNDLSTHKPLGSNGFHSKRILEDITTFLPSFDNEDSDLMAVTKFKKQEDILHSVKSAEYNPDQAFCQLYSGEVCKDFHQDRFVFVQPPYTQEIIEQNLKDSFIVVSQSNEISSGCSKFVLPIMCYSAFPLCADPGQTNIYQQYYINKYNVLEKYKNLKLLRTMPNLNIQRICKQDCLLLETEVCSKEYSIAKRHPVLGRMLELEECENLPEDGDTSSVECLKLGVERAQNVNSDETCYWDRGQDYRGTLDVTLTNTKCIRWAHQTHITASDYPELIGHNFCRNPNGQMLEPFCYVEHNKREVCGLPKCAKILWTYIIGTSAILMTLVTFGICLYCCKGRTKRARGIRNLNVPSADKNIYGNGSPSAPMEMNSLLPSHVPPMGTHRSSVSHHHNSSKNGFQNVPQYNLKDVTLVEELGEGAFGKVYKGELRTKMGPKVFVAVKSLKENASAKTLADFQREIELISELRHPNIICLLGVVMKQEPMSMLFEYMSEGDLHEFLISNSPSEGRSLNALQFLHVSYQIALGMEYLSGNHYVHRDLAARNCLVSKDLVVKISDFGLSRDMYSCDYYRVQSKSLLPVRWMPPESILYGKFTTESDVWSYGVVLWEIFSYGLQPYYGFNNQEVINMIRARKLLPCPEACPSYVYSLMVECWAELAIRRPSFAEISHRLRVWKQNESTATNTFFKTPQHHSSEGSSGHKSSDHSTIQQCPTFENPEDPSATWERNLGSKPRVSGSQSSLTSRSSLGTKTQSTNLSDHPNLRQCSSGRRSADRKSQRSLVRHDCNSLDRLQSQHQP